MVCVQFNICSVAYFLDKMKPYELMLICESLHLRVKDSWEQTRLLGYITAQVHNTKRMKPTDVIKFAWEQSEETKEIAPSNELTQEDVERIKAMAKQREMVLKEKGII